jgi:hypothetical protein
MGYGQLAIGKQHYSTLLNTTLGYWQLDTKKMESEALSIFLYVYYDLCCFLVRLEQAYHTKSSQGCVENQTLV